jgi:hypothetical protein
MQTPESVRARMQAVARDVSKHLPAGYGFFVLCFKFGSTNDPCEYVSNARRQDVIEAMREFLLRNPIQDPSLN